MNKILLWILRSVGLFGCFWFFYWTFIHDLVVWEKEYPHLTNLIYLLGCVILCTIPNFTRGKATKKELKQTTIKKTSLRELQDKILNAKTPEEKAKTKKELTEYLKKHS